MTFRAGATAVVILSSLLWGPPVRGDTPSELVRNIVGLEKRLWKAWVEGDATTFEKFVTKDYRAIGSWGRRTKAEFLESLGSCEVHDYSLSDFDLIVVSEDVVLLTYEAEQDATCDGKRLPARVMSSSLYVLRDDHWRSALYQETSLTP